MTTAVALMTIAAYHSEQGDLLASRACIRRACDLTFQNADYEFILGRLQKRQSRRLRGKA
jgi:hypothetical protein